MNLRRITDDIYLLWLVMALPGVWLLWERLVLHTKMDYIWWTGLPSCWFLILTMAITPLQQLLGRPLPWLRKRRRYFGVASFGYAALHTFIWLLGVNMGGLIRSFQRMDLLTGWIAMAIMTVLAATSFDAAVDSMGPAWKRVQRWAYPMAVLTLMHWVMTDYGGWREVAVYTVPLILIEAWRIRRYRRRMRLRRA